jgi:DNA-binding NarL/FixJ family response regulator
MVLPAVIEARAGRACEPAAPLRILYARGDVAGNAHRWATGDTGRRVGAVTVVMADRQAPILRGVCDFLTSRGIEVVGRTHDGQEALELIERLQPTVALLDPNLRPLDGIEIAARARESAPRTAIVVYADLRYRDLLVDALEAGARGFLAKDAPLRDVLRAIEMVCDGRYFVSPRALGLLDGQHRLTRTTRLTRRERDLLRLVINGVRGVDLRRELPGASRDVGRELTRAVSKLEEERIRFIALPRAVNGL